MEWYVVHAYSGFENSVKRSLEDRINRLEMTEHFGQILVAPRERLPEGHGLYRGYK
jgi:transcriptional antiterminator NusG